MIALAAAFVLTALLYASVGFAGGSTYNALLVLAGVDHRVFPLVALACNLIVATGGTLRFGRAGLMPWRRVAPLLALSVPAAWVGGMIHVPKALFLLLLGLSLLAAAALLLLQREEGQEARRIAVRVPWLALAAAGPIGLLSGIVGIGGGIFLAPLLHLIRWDGARRVAAAASLFILANSLAGISGHVMKLGRGDEAVLGAALSYWPLALAVLIGGQIGSHLAASRISPVLIRRLTALLILYVACRLLLQWWQGL
jgi:uncharacterized protein